MENSKALSALAAIQNATTASLRTQVEGIVKEVLAELPPTRGPVGERGRDGTPAPPVKITIGKVESGAGPHAKIRETGENNFTLDLVLPQGSPGERGATGDRGPAGQSIEGKPGRDGASVRGARGESGITPSIKIGEVIVGETATVTATPNENGSRVVFNFTIPKAQDGKDGAQGDPGRDGMSADEIKTIVRKTILEVLSTTSVLDANTRRCAEIKGILRKAINSADERHIAQVSGICRSIEKVLDGDPFTGEEQ
jgi:hypothetical protein